MEWTWKRENILIRGILLISVIVAIIDFLPEDILPISFKEHIPAMILFVLSVITAIQTLERREEIQEQESQLEKIFKRFPVEIVQGNDEIRRLGVYVIERAKHNIKLVSLGEGAYSSTDESLVSKDFIEALKSKIKKTKEHFRYQCILSYDPEKDSEIIKNYIHDENHFSRQHPDSVKYKFLREKRINLNIVMIDNTDLIISFISSGKRFYKVFRFNDNESVENISDWFSDLWSNAEPIDSLCPPNDS